MNVTKLLAGLGLLAMTTGMAFAGAVSMAPAEMQYNVPEAAVISWRGTPSFVLEPAEAAVIMGVGTASASAIVDYNSNYPDAYLKMDFNWLNPPVEGADFLLEAKVDGFAWDTVTSVPYSKTIATSGSRPNAALIQLKVSNVDLDDIAGAYTGQVVMTIQSHP
jgi:hypothetical protein